MLVMLIPLALLTLGIIFLIRCYQTYLKARATQRWPSTQGTVVISRIDEQGTSGEFTYKPVVTYEYQVNGCNITCSKLQLGDEFLTNGSHSQAERLIKEFPVGQTVEVFYNPDDPGEAVLVEGISTKYLWLGLVVSGIFFFGAVVAYFNPGFPFV